MCSWTSRRLVGAVVVVLIALAAPADARSPWQPIEGTYHQAPAGCIPAGDDPSAGRLSCVGSVTWLGTWTGQSVYTFEMGVDDLATGGRVTVDETLVATDDEGRSGTIRWLVDLTFTPSAVPGTYDVRYSGTIVDATGDFCGARAELVGTGVIVGAAQTGEYHGRWFPPRHGAAC